MHETAQKIISVLRKGASDTSTSKILGEINPEYYELKEKLKRKNSHEFRRSLAQIHRKTLHHLNKLASMGIISVTKYGERGEKYFSLNLGDNEELLEFAPSYKKRMIVSKSLTPALPIEGYEQKDIVARFEPATWIDRLNSVMIFSNNVKDLDELYKLITDNIFSVVNDTIHIYNFEKMTSSEKLESFFVKIDEECKDYGKRISFDVDIDELSDARNFLKAISLVNLEKINIIYSVPRDLSEKKYEILKKISEICFKNKRSFYIKNKGLHNAPYYVGRAGPYCLAEKEWNLAEDLREKSLCIGCSQSCVVVDVDKFYSEEGLSIESFSELMLNISKSMFYANSIQRRRSEDCFRNVNKLNKGYEAEFLALSRNYIRFWNFGLVQPEINQDFVLNMISEARKKVNEFASAEETIYKSCGMTTRFKIVLSSAFKESMRLSPAKYKKLVVSKVEDLDKKEVKQILSSRETLCDIFDGGDEITFHYSGEFDSENIMRQLSFILKNYRIPFFNFSFDEVKGDLKLSHFI